jgi:hypothetical protein
MATLDIPRVTQVTPASAFRQMGWAFLFLGISIGPSFRLGHENFLIDLLPDFIGYLLIATAANRLVPLHPRARGVRNLGLLLTYLSIPTIIQYTVVTSQSGNITTWRAPLWPLSIIIGLFDLVLVWMLCGLVADLADRVGDVTIEQSAQVRRVVYILLKTLLTGGLVLLLVSPNPELILAGAIAGVVVGLLLLGLMMGLMRKAARMCEDWPASILPPAEARDYARPGGWVFRVLALGGVLLPVALAVGGFYYYHEWDQARAEAWRFGENGGSYSRVGDEFCDHLLAGRIDDAYEITTVDFKSHVSREQLAELARKYVGYKNLPRAGRRGGGDSMSGPAGGDRGSLQLQRVTKSEYITMWDGKTTQVTITICRDRDSILSPTPPPLRVDDFKVDEMVTPERLAPGFGRPGRRLP